MRALRTNFLTGFGGTFNCSKAALENIIEHMEIYFCADPDARKYCAEFNLNKKKTTALKPPEVLEPATNHGS